jgi:hypothetical protein
MAEGFIHAAVRRMASMKISIARGYDDPLPRCSAGGAVGQPPAWWLTLGMGECLFIWPGC